MPSFLQRNFKTLSNQVDKNIEESLYVNDFFMNRRWSFFEKNILKWSINYQRYILLTLILFTLLLSNLVLWQPLLKPYVLPYVPHWEKLLDWQGAFLGGQLTIVGVVYPLVIGLVSVLFQNKSAKQVILPIYQKYSGFMFSGLSGLTLSAFIILGYFFRPMLKDSTYAAICISSAVWLLVNVLLTVWFFTKTFRILDESSREKIVFLFAIIEIAKNDVRQRIKGMLLANAVECKLLKNTDADVMDVMTQKFSEDNYQEIILKSNADSNLQNVRFWMLNVAINLQIFILKIRNIKGCKLIVNPQRKSSVKNSVVVVRYDGFYMNPLAKVLIKYSFSFCPNTSLEDVGLSKILVSFVNSADDALRDKSVRDFSNALKNLASWHTQVAQALSFINDDGKLDNWLLLPADGTWWKSYLNELLEEYYRLARDTVELIPTNSRYYKEMINFPKRIFASRNTLINEEIHSLIQANHFMWHLLIEWRTHNLETSDLRTSDKYKEMLYEFVGAWESWLIYIEPRSIQVQDINKSYPALINHLAFTGSTAVSALRFDNFEAAGWGVDMINNWFNNLSHHDNWPEEYSWRSVLINHCLLKIEKDHLVWKNILRGEQFNNSAAFNLAFENASLDLRVVTACYMLLKPGDTHRDLLSKYVIALLSGVRIHPTGSIDQASKNVSSAGDLLGAYIRQRDYRHHGDVNYGSWLSSILRSFGQIFEEMKVSGRIYSDWYANDLQSLNRAYVEIGIFMSTSQWELPSQWEEAILSSGEFRHVDQQSVVSDLREWIRIANEDHNYIIVPPERCADFRSNFVASLDGVINKILHIQNKNVLNADIDRERCIELGMASSRIFMAAEPPPYPLALFEKIDRYSNLADDCAFKVNVLDYAKEDIAANVETRRASNEYEWLAEAVSNNVENNVIRMLIQYPQSGQYKYNTVENFLSGVQEASGSEALPVLFIGDRAVFNSLSRSFHDKDFRERHNILRQAGYGKRYVCHIGACEVYQISFRGINYSLFTSKEIFETVRFRELSEGRYVNVDFELDEESETMGKLKLEYWMKAELTQGVTCLKLELNSRDD